MYAETIPTTATSLSAPLLKHLLQTAKLNVFGAAEAAERLVFDEPVEALELLDRASQDLRDVMEAAEGARLAPAVALRLLPRAAEDARDQAADFESQTERGGSAFSGAQRSACEEASLLLYTIAAEADEACSALSAG